MKTVFRTLILTVVFSVWINKAYSQKLFEDENVVVSHEINKIDSFVIAQCTGEDEFKMYVWKVKFDIKNKSNKLLMPSINVIGTLSFDFPSDVRPNCAIINSLDNFKVMGKYREWGFPWVYLTHAVPNFRLEPFKSYSITRYYYILEGKKLLLERWSFPGYKILKDYDQKKKKKVQKKKEKKPIADKSINNTKSSYEETLFDDGKISMKYRLKKTDKKTSCKASFTSPDPLKMPYYPIWELQVIIKNISNSKITPTKRKTGYLKINPYKAETCRFWKKISNNGIGLIDYNTTGDVSVFCKGFAENCDGLEPNQSIVSRSYFVVKNNEIPKVIDWGISGYKIEEDEEDDFWKEDRLEVNIIAPKDGSSSKNNVVNFNAKYNILSDGFEGYLEYNGVLQRVVPTNGNFRGKIVLKSGENNVKFTIKSGDTEIYQESLKVNYTGKPVKLRATLTWDGYADIDLHLIDANNRECSYKNPNTDLAQLDVDNQKAYGPENISVEKVIEGDYIISIVNFAKGVNNTATVYIYINEQLDSVHEHTFTYKNEKVEIKKLKF